MSECNDRKTRGKKCRKEKKGYKIEISKLGIKDYNTNIYSRHVQHELYNRLIDERGKVREM